MPKYIIKDIEISSNKPGKKDFDEKSLKNRQLNRTF